MVGNIIFLGQGQHHQDYEDEVQRYNNAEEHVEMIKAQRTDYETEQKAFQRHQREREKEILAKHEELERQREKLRKLRHKVNEQRHAARVANIKRMQSEGHGDGIEHMQQVSYKINHIE